MKRWISNLFFLLYAIKIPRVRGLILTIITRLEGGEPYSSTLRKIFAKYYNLHIGMYTYGSCFVPKNNFAKLLIGRYCSFASGVNIFSANHPLQFKSTHPFFFNRMFGYVTEEQVQRTELVIGNDVWVGCNAIILPNVNRIGDGAIIGAGAVVTRNVPDFAVVAGNPATIIKYRFSQKMQTSIKQSAWWDKDIKELQHCMEEFLHPLEEKTT